MKFKKKCYSTKLCDLYGEDNYESHIEEGREYWLCDFDDVKWRKIKITHIRSGVAFYVFTDSPEIPEKYMPLGSFIAATLHFAEIDPCKDIKDIDKSDTDYFKDASRLYCFDDEYTIVKNWDNEKYIELTEEDGDLFLLAYLICQKA